MSGPALLVVVGSGGVGKTTLAAALGARAARRGERTLVMTFDPSRRLKDALGVDERAAELPVRAPFDAPGRLDVSLLDARRTFDGLVTRYAPDPASRDRILRNRFYDHLAGRLSGILEYMAVERLFEVASDSRYDRIVLDTPPTRQALDFLEAPQRIVAFLDSGALRIALRPWFADDGRLRVGRVPLVGRGIESFLDRVVGLGLLREMAEFFQAFAPLYDGFRARATEVDALLRAERTRFALVAAPGEERIADTMFFARQLRETGHRLGPIVVNRVHPPASGSGSRSAGDASRAERRARRLVAWLARHDAAGLERLRVLAPDDAVLALEMCPAPPTNIAALDRLGERLEALDMTGALWGETAQA